MDWRTSFTYGHASSFPPGMMDGPYRAPSSPPDTPVPTNRKPFPARYLARRLESGKWEFPPSMMMSPGSAPPSRDVGQTCARKHGRRTGYDQLDKVVDG